jgi:hypothetical protein
MTNPKNPFIHSVPMRSLRSSRPLREVLGKKMTISANPLAGIVTETPHLTASTFQRFNAQAEICENCALKAA